MAEDRLAAAREAALLHPDSVAAAFAHGEVLLASADVAAAIGEFQRALRLDHEYRDARFGLGRAWLCAGEPEKALEAFARLAEDYPGLTERIAEADAMLARPRSDAGYVRHLFDQFSADYDACMTGQLSYRAPGILRELAGLVVPKREGLSILDLGCGTGLAGAAFRDMAKRLDGIDLSPAMIEKAKARRIYDALALADLETALAGTGPAYDLILAADTLVYLGDLAVVFTGAARRLRRGGFFLFTVEKHDGEGFALGPKRRWRHSEAYLRGQAGNAGFDVSGLVACAPRSEKNLPVEGLAAAFARAQ